MTTLQNTQTLQQGPSFRSACLGFVSSTVGLVAVMVLLGSM